MKYGLALEGGGAKGAYQIGVVKALIDNGYEFEAVVGTSIGALNAAMVVQDRIDDAIDLWSNISYKKMFNVDDKKVSSALSAKIDLEIVKYFSSKFGQILKNGGISTENIRKILVDNVDEKKVRKSKMKFGLVTVCLSDKEVKQVFIDEIPKGELIDYLMATSSLPVFKRAKIDNKSYLDGGVYDNCPVEMLEKKGIKNVIAIRNYKRMRIRNYKNIIKKNDINLYMVEPVDNLPGILKFDSKNTNELLRLGYFDGIKFAKKLDGIRYYVNSQEEKKFVHMLVDYDIDEMAKIAKGLDFEFSSYDNLRKIFLEEILNALVSKTLVKEAATYKEVVYALIEHVAKKENVEKYKIYDFNDFLDIVKSKITLRGKTKQEQAIYRFVKYLKYTD
mgnify:FL=1